VTKHARTLKQRGILWLISLIILILFLCPAIAGQIQIPGVNSAGNTTTMCGKQRTTSFCEIAAHTAGHSTTKATTDSSHTATSITKTPSPKGNVPTLQKPTSDPNAGWQLVWSDEFNSPTLDTTKWTALDGGHFYTPPTAESYAPNDTYIQPGQGLVFKSEKRSYSGYDYTSGGVSSQGKFSLLYGKIEWREQLPQGKGIWPTIWLMPENGSTAYEIDMLELVGNDPHTLYMNYHWQDANGNTQQNMTHLNGPDFSAGFHTFDLQWTAGSLGWSIDGVVEKTITSNILNTPMFMYMNTAVGGNGTWPGLPDSTTVFPQYTKISYVRVYKATGTTGA